MKIIKNAVEEFEQKLKSPISIKCRNCGSLLEVESHDLHIGEKQQLDMKNEYYQEKIICAKCQVCDFDIDCTSDVKEITGMEYNEIFKVVGILTI